jgi:hypothetical protein
VDPITLILLALAAGAATGLQDTAATAVKDAYSAFKSLIRSRFGHHDQVVEQQLAAIDQKPDTDPAPLAARLQTIDAGNDSELVRAAEALLQQADPDGKWRLQFNTSISQSKGIVVNNSGAVTMNFNDGD